MNANDSKQSIANDLPLAGCGDKHPVVSAFVGVHRRLMAVLE
jgi:hypothetical protein